MFIENFEKEYAAPKPKKRESKAAYKKTSNDKSGSYKNKQEYDITGTENMVKNKRYFSVKKNLVNELACRWHYILPDWPPEMDYKLYKHGLYLVEEEEFEEAQEINERGYTKVIQVQSYPGLFLDSKGQIYDLRPYDS